MNFKLLLHTVSHLKLTQVVFQVKNRLVKPKYVPFTAPKHGALKLQTEPIPRYKSLEKDSFTFLNLEHGFSGWNFTGNGMLWAYNLNYFDFINQKDISAEEACKWIDRFIEELPNNRVGLDPYPIALRGINWIKFFCSHLECVSQARDNSLYSQYKLLEKKLEYHLLGNHLLEDAYSLYIGGSYFQDKALMQKAYDLLIAQLKEQTLPDGAHYEQSVMYHCILLDRLLDCINVSPTNELKEIAKRQVGWLKSVCYKDGSFPLFNDAALGIAPSAAEILDYASRLGISNDATALEASGYRKLQNSSMEAIVDVGNITATYQPGHSHADTFNYELRINGIPFVVDTGISTYDKTARRQYERSTVAHNCVSVEGKDSSEVWGGFRVGNRCKVHVTCDEANKVEAWHDGFKHKCIRSFRMLDNSFIVEDSYPGEAVSYIHLDANASLDRIKIEGSEQVEVYDEKYSVEYNRFIEAKVLKVYFKNKLKYTIQ